MAVSRNRFWAVLGLAALLGLCACGETPPQKPADEQTNSTKEKNIF